MTGLVEWTDVSRYKIPVLAQPIMTQCLFWLNLGVWLDPESVEPQSALSQKPYFIYLLVVILVISLYCDLKVETSLKICICCSDCDLSKLTNAHENCSKLVKLLHVNENLLNDMVERSCITTDLMNSVLDHPTPEEQNRALFDALKQPGLAKFEQIVECFRHSRQNAALLWVLEHDGGFLSSLVLMYFIFSSFCIHLVVLYLMAKLHHG